MRSFLAWMACLWFVTGAFAQSTADAEQCANAGDSGDDTIAACTRAIKSGQLSSVNLAITFYNRGNTWGRKGDNDRALADYNETILLNPQSALAYHNRGNIWGRKGDNERALADYNEAIRLNPQYADAHNNRGNIWDRKGDNDRALVDYNEAIRLNPQYADAYNNRGNTWDRTGDNDRALADYNEAIRLNPKLALAYNNRGNTWDRKGDNDRALADYNEAIRLNPKYALAYNSRGNTWGRKDDNDRALADYSEAIRLNPQYAAAYTNRGRSQFHLGRFDAAAADLGRGLAFEPQQPYDVIWRYLALARGAGVQSAKVELAKGAVPLDRQKWPAPVIAFLEGRIDLAGLGEGARHADPKTRADQSCEVAFYVGQWHLLNKRSMDARGYLREAEQKCPKGFIEYNGAVAELKRLGAP